MVRRTRREEAQVVVLFALLLPVIMGVGAVVIGVGNWYTHAKHLQTKADAAALAGGGVWGFPCGADSDTTIEGQARKYAGPHTQADGTPYTLTTLNPQVGGVGAPAIHAVLNGPDWFDDDSNPNPSEKSSPAGSICQAQTLDVKLTESNSFPLFSLIPIYPDIKRKARVQIREIESLSGLLPIAVRVPKPVSAAAIFYDESSGGIRDVRYFCEADPSTITGLPPGLGAWTTLDPANASGLCSGWASFDVTEMTGVAIATSFRPACTAAITANCFEDAGFLNVNDLCRQGGGGIVQCFFGSGTGATQTVSSGLQFIRGYQTPQSNQQIGSGPPELGSAWLSPGACVGGYGSGYFAAVTGTCSALLSANFLLGTCIRGPGACIDNATSPPTETRTAANTEVKYTLVHGTGNNDDTCNFGPTCDLAASWSTPLTISPQRARHAIALRVRLKDTFVPNRPGCSNTKFNGQCEWYFTAAGRVLTQPSNATIFANPVQRAFMGDDDRSGPVKFLRIHADRNCDSGGVPDSIDNEAGSQPIGSTHCFYLQIGLKGGVAADQDEPPIAFNLTGSAQSALVDCDESFSNLRDEIEYGCLSPSYRLNGFNTTPVCPGSTQFFSTPKPAPFDTWPPFACVLTQTTASATPGQLIQGFNLRFFGQQSNPSCPVEDTSWTPPAPAPWTKGRNYWHDANNQIDEYTFAQDAPPPTRSNRLRDDDPRMINLFMTAYDSFGGSGNTTFPIVNFGTFYVTGYGQVSGSGLTIQDPCTSGTTTNTSPGAGSKPPPDLNTSSNGAYVWGHFVNNVVPSPNATASERICAPSESVTPCVAVLVE